MDHRHCRLRHTGRIGQRPEDHFHVRTGGEHVITVVGCGGDRDKTKRATMAQRAAHGSDGSS